MKSALSQFACLALVVAAGLSTTGCSKTNAQNPQGSGQTQEGPAWTVTFQSSCGLEASANPEAAARCAGRHGFAVSANKTWQAGPAPQGQVKSGMLSDEDFAKLEAALNELATQAPLGSLVSGCSNDAANADAEASGVKLSLEYRGAKSSLCTAQGSSSTPEQLLAAMSDLASKYYPVPFPDACADAADAVHALYPALQSCNTDADCSYINSGYELVSKSVAEFVLTDDCTMVRPLAVGNAAAVKGSQDKLLNALNQAQSACGARLIRSSCGQVEGFDSTSVAAPVCGENKVCRISSAR